MRATVVALVGAAVLAPGASAATVGGCWQARVARAVAWAEPRTGEVAIAVVAPGGRRFGHAARRPMRTASLLKALVLAADLREPAVARRALTAAERGLLEPMIRRSANAPVGVLVGRLPPGALDRAARAAGMTAFAGAWPLWGVSTTTAADQAAFFAHLDELLPARHRDYARRLLGSVVPSQRWGLPVGAPHGWLLLFKGGWGSGTGRVASQAARLEWNGVPVAVAVLTEHSPSHGYRTATLAGVARRLLLPRPCGGRWETAASTVTVE